MGAFSEGEKFIQSISQKWIKKQDEEMEINWFRNEKSIHSLVTSSLLSFPLSKKWLINYPRLSSNRKHQEIGSGIFHCN